MNLIYFEIIRNLNLCFYYFLYFTFNQLNNLVPRENDQFGRNINLQLTYSFQQSSTQPHSMQPFSGGLLNNNSCILKNSIPSKTGLRQGN